MKIKITINGRPIERDVDPEMRLLDFIRNELGITSVKDGCGIGVCGVCTVLIDGKPRQSCITKMKSVDGKNITTVEGLGTPNKLHPLQELFIKHDAVQCGFCTPAMILVGYALVRDNPNVTREQIKRGISRVLCRCTGYIPIVNAIEEYAKLMRGEKTS